MKRIIFLIGLVSIVAISSLVAAESEEPVSPPDHVVVEPDQVTIDGVFPTVGIPELFQPEVCAAPEALSGSGENPLCITCTTHQQCFFACGWEHGSCFPDFGGFCGPPTRNICFCF